MAFTDALPAGFLKKIFGKKTAAPSPALKKADSFSNPVPNIPKSPAAGAKTHKSSAENVQKFTQKVDHAQTVAAKQRVQNQKAGNTALATGNQRTDHYMNHNREQIKIARDSGAKIAVSRSPSQKNHLYHAVHRK